MSVCGLYEGKIGRVRDCMCIDYLKRSERGTECVCTLCEGKR